MRNGAYASRAVDGNKASDFFEKSCTHTDNETDPWFLVELDRPYAIHSVALTNREDCCGKYNTIEMHLYGHRWLEITIIATPFHRNSAQNYNSAKGTKI